MSFSQNRAATHLAVENGRVKKKRLSAGVRVRFPGA